MFFSLPFPSSPLVSSPSSVSGNILTVNPGPHHLLPPPRPSSSNSNCVTPNSSHSSQASPVLRPAAPHAAVTHAVDSASPAARQLNFQQQETANANHPAEPATQQQQQQQQQSPPQHQQQMQMQQHPMHSQIGS